MKWNSLTRRFFLQGSGKTILSLPALPSLAALVPDYAIGAPGDQVAFGTFFTAGGMWYECGAPNPHDPKGLNLGPITKNGNSAWAELKNIQGSHYGEALPKKHWEDAIADMLFMWNLSHTGFHHNSAYAFRTGAEVPSVETIVAASNQANPMGTKPVYLNSTHRQGALNIPVAATVTNSRVSMVSPIFNAEAIFSRLFGNYTPPKPNNNPTTVDTARQAQLKALEQVEADYQRLLSKQTPHGRRISAKDLEIVKRWRDDMYRFAEQIQKMAPVTSANPAKVPTKPTAAEQENPILRTKVMMELLAAGIKANVCHFFNHVFFATSAEIPMDFTNTTFPFFDPSPGRLRWPDFHFGISHEVKNKAYHIDAYRFMFAAMRYFWFLLSEEKDNLGGKYSDNVIISSMGDLGMGPRGIPNDHSHQNNMSLNLIGKSFQNQITTGRTVSHGSDFPSNQLWISLMDTLAPEWRQLLAGWNKQPLSEAGFGKYGGKQQTLSDAQKRAGLPFLKV